MKALLVLFYLYIYIYYFNLLSTLEQQHWKFFLFYYNRLKSPINLYFSQRFSSNVSLSNADKVSKD